MSEPPDDAYGRVTNPERFRPLHAIADEVVEELTRVYDVERSDGPDIDLELTSRIPGEMTVTRLVPVIDTAAPITVARTAFPGLVVRYGKWHIEAYPACGCDACNDDVDRLDEHFRRNVGAVTAGRFTEAFDGTHLEHKFAEPGSSRQSGWHLVRDNDIARYGEPSSIGWEAWPRR